MNKYEVKTYYHAGLVCPNPRTMVDLRPTMKMFNELEHAERMAKYSLQSNFYFNPIWYIIGIQIGAVLGLSLYWLLTYLKY